MSVILEINKLIEPFQLNESINYVSNYRDT